MLVSAKDGSLLIAAQFTGAHAAPCGTIHFDKIGLGVRVRDCHIKGMARANAAPADEGKIFFRFGNNFLLFVQIVKVGFRNAAEEFLHPSPAIMADFHRVEGSQCFPHSLCPETSVHCSASCWGAHC